MTVLKTHGNGYDEAVLWQILLVQSRLIIAFDRSQWLQYHAASWLYSDAVQKLKIYGSFILVKRL